MKFMVVEDDENSRVLQHTILEAAGHQVTSAANGREALQLIARERPEVIVSDIMMPELDGYALCRAIKSNPDYAAIPFVFYSATYTSPADQQLALELGGACFLVKPMDPTEFMQQIDSVLARISESASAPRVVPLDLDAVDVRYAHTIARKLDKKIVELKETRHQLASTEARLRLIEENHRTAQQIAHLGSWDLEIRTGEWWWSEELYALLGLADGPRTPGRERLMERIAPEDRPRFERATALAEEKGIPFRMELRVLGPADETRICYAEGRIAATDPSSGKPIRLICAMQDITRMRQMEDEKGRLEASLRQAQKMEALGTLAGSIAHDFNNILSAILNSAELLRVSPDAPDAEKQECLNIILDAGRRAADLVKQIKTFSKPSDQSRQPVDIGAVIQEAIKFLRHTADAGIEIQYRPDTHCPPVLANATQLHQVIMNLCVNAIQAMAAKPGVLEISTTAVEISSWDRIALDGLKAGRYVVVGVRDTGIGMDDATRERIFEPYFTTREQNEGTGLGLSVVHGIVLGLNGKITVTSAPQQGTTIAVYLPVA